MRLPCHGTEKCTRVAAPTSIGTLVVWNQRTGELIDVVGILDFGKQVPLYRALIERIQHQVAASGVVESTEVTAVRICDHGAVASLECGPQDLLDRAAFPGPCRTDQLEMLGLVGHRKDGARQRYLSTVGVRAFRSIGPPRLIRYDRTPLMNFRIGDIFGLDTSSRITKRHTDRGA